MCGVWCVCTRISLFSPQTPRTVARTFPSPSPMFILSVHRSLGLKSRGSGEGGFGIACTSPPLPPYPAPNQLPTPLSPPLTSLPCSPSPLASSHPPRACTSLSPVHRCAPVPLIDSSISSTNLSTGAQQFRAHEAAVPLSLTPNISSLGALPRRIDHTHRHSRPLQPRRTSHPAWPR